MATRSLGTKITMDGEQEYRDAIKKMNTDLKTLSTEMQKVTAKFQDNAKSEEAVTEKGKLLQNILEEQQKKVKKLQEALKDAKEAYGENAEETQKWQQQLNRAERDLYNTEHAIKKNSEALEDAGKETENYSRISLKAFTAVTAAVAAAVKAYQQLFDITREIAANADETMTLASITGLDTETIQQMKYAAEFVDVSFETIKGSLTKLKNNMQDAKNGSTKLADAFRQLGVSVTNQSGDLRDAEDVFYELVDALGSVENQTERDALAMDLFGKKAEDLNPLIAAGSKALREYGEEAEEMGYILDESALKKLGAVDDAYQKLQNTQEAAKKQIASELAPSVEKFYTMWGEVINGVAKAMVESGIIEGLGNILETVTKLLSPISWLFNTAIPAIREEMKKLDDLMFNIKTSWPIQMILDMVDAINLLVSPGKQIETIVGLKNAGSREMRPMNEWYNAPGDMNFVGGRTWVGENGPELVTLPAGSAIHNAQESREMSGDTFYITIDAKNVQEFNDIIRIVKNSRVRARMG